MPTTVSPTKVMIPSLASIPQSAVHITLTKDFNQPLIEQVPSSVTHIIDESLCNSRILMLPPFLTHITFSGEFDQPVDYLLPQSLKHLTFGNNFNQPVDNLPPSLKNFQQLCWQSISWPHHNAFEQPLDHLPQSLKTLNLHKDYNEPLDYLPKSLTRLQLGKFGKSIEYFPKSIKHIMIDKDIRGDETLGNVLPNLINRE